MGLEVGSLIPGLTRDLLRINKKYRDTAFLNFLLILCVSVPLC